MVAISVGHRTCDSQILGSSSGWAPLRSGLGQATYICVPLTKQYNLVLAKGRLRSVAGKVTVGLASH